MLNQYIYKYIFYTSVESTLVLDWKVPTDDRYTPLPRHFLSIEHRLLVFQDLMSEVISGFISVQM